MSSALATTPIRHCGYPGTAPGVVNVVICRIESGQESMGMRLSLLAKMVSVSDTRVVPIISLSCCCLMQVPCGDHPDLVLVYMLPAGSSALSAGIKEVREAAVMLFK